MVSLLRHVHALLCATLALAAAAADAQQHADHAEHAEHADQAAPISADDRAAAFPDLGGIGHMHLEDPLNRSVLLDRFESQDDDGNPVAWDLDAWVGRDLTKLWIRSDGERRDGNTEQADVEILWGKSFARWWDLLTGVREEPNPDPSLITSQQKGVAQHTGAVDGEVYLTELRRTAKVSKNPKVFSE